MATVIRQLVSTVSLVVVSSAVTAGVAHVTAAPTSPAIARPAPAPAVSTRAAAGFLACADAKHRLRLLSGGKCPRHFHRVTLGRTGPAGPGAVSAVTRDGGGGSRRVAVPGMGLDAVVSCDPLGERNVIDVVPTGQSATVYEVRGDTEFTTGGSASADVVNEVGNRVQALPAGHGVLNFYSGSRTALVLNGEGALHASIVLTRGHRTALLTVVLDYSGCYSAVVAVPA